ncbi:DUF1016 N-terminal domain-containing protein [Wolbachia pipientis]|nr:DUF1016 N-terminal domain-containing protein [Wolbachia pipientis]ONI56696.1 hypothetical protein N500_0230 [Wolbachia pipientis wUni]
MTKIIGKEYTELLEQLKDRIATNRYKAALAVNSKLILLYHHIGTEILKRQKEHTWGAKVIDQLSKDINKPIGLAEYRITENLPENIKTALPTIEELEAELSKISDKEK